MRFLWQISRDISFIQVINIIYTFFVRFILVQYMYAPLISKNNRYTAQCRISHRNVCFSSFPNDALHQRGDIFSLHIIHFCSAHMTVLRCVALDWIRFAVVFCR